MEILNEKSTEEIAQRIYELSQDMDWMDYEHEKAEEIAELEKCLYYIRTVAQNEHNADYFRTFYNALQRI